MAAELLGKKVTCPSCRSEVTVDQMSLGAERHEPPDHVYDHLLWMCPTPDCPMMLIIIMLPEDLECYISAGCTVSYWPLATYDVRLRVRSTLGYDPMVPLRPVTDDDLAKFHSACERLTGADEFRYLTSGQLPDSA